MHEDRTIKTNDPADFAPQLGNYKSLHHFRYWCQKVLPLVYDDSLSYYELLCKVVDYLNKTMEDVETLHGNVTNLYTAYEKLQNYVNEYFSTLDVQEEINKKLDEMAKDGTLERLLNNFLQVINNYSVSENVLGTFITSNNYINSCCFKHDGIIYAFSSPTNEYGIAHKTNVGILRCFNLMSNVEITGLSKEIEMGHANSVCYDGTNVYIVPVWDFSSGVANNAMYIYKYESLNFNNFIKLTTPVNFMGCSYDNGTLYFYGYDNNIYILNGETFTLYHHVNVPDVIFGNYNQDFSIKDNVVYLSTPQGLLTKFILINNNYEPKLSMYLNYLDAECNYYLGESEGFEFTSDGHLLHSRYTNLGNLNIGFICEIPTNVNMYNIVNASYSSSNNTYTISDKTRTTFKNNKYEVKCISEIQCKYEKPNRLIINDDYTENGCVIRNSMILNTDSATTFTCNTINVFGCTLTLGESNITFTSDSFIQGVRGSIINITAYANIKTTSEKSTKQIVFIGDNGTLVLLSNKLSNITGKKTIGDTEIYTEGIYKGSVFFGVKHDGGLATYSEGVGSKSFHKFNITFETVFDTVPYVNANIFTTSENVNMGNISIGISNISKSGFTATIYNNSDVTLIPAVNWFAIQPPF